MGGGLLDRRSLGHEALAQERQGRLADGLLVRPGLPLGYIWHPAGFAVAGFVGVGQTLARASDWRGLASLLARAPGIAPLRGGRARPFVLPAR